MNTLNAIASELEAAKQDLELYQRLTGAERRVKQLTKDYEAAQVAHEKQEEARLRAESEARFDGLSDIRVTRVGKPEEGVLRAAFDVSWTQAVFDWRYSGESRSTRMTTRGFLGVPPDVLTYLIEKHPERVPHEIAELAPGNPAEAFATYFTGLKRGYLVGKSSE